MAEDFVDDDIPDECDFSKGVRVGNKYAAHFAKGVSVRILGENGTVIAEHDLGKNLQREMVKRSQEDIKKLRIPEE